MGRIEGATRDVFAMMSRAESVFLDRGQQHALATWATIVAMLRSSQEPGTPAATEEEVRRVRERDEPAPGMGVWMVRGLPRPTLASRHMRGLSPDGLLCWSNMTWIGEAVFVVSSAALAESTSILLSVLPSAVVRIYPTSEVAE